MRDSHAIPFRQLGLMALFTIFLMPHKVKAQATPHHKKDSTSTIHHIKITQPQEVHIIQEDLITPNEEEETDEELTGMDSADLTEDDFDTPNDESSFKANRKKLATTSTLTEKPTISNVENEIGLDEPEKVKRKTITGKASYYHPRFSGRKTANGEIFSERKFTAASNHFKLGTYVKVTNKQNGKQIYVKINDRMGHPKRVIDMTILAARVLGYFNGGITGVLIEEVSKTIGREKIKEQREKYRSLRKRIR